MCVSELLQRDLASSYFNFIDILGSQNSSEFVLPCTVMYFLIILIKGLSLVENGNFFENLYYDRTCVLLLELCCTHYFILKH